MSIYPLCQNNDHEMNCQNKDHQMSWQDTITRAGHAAGGSPPDALHDARSESPPPHVACPPCTNCWHSRSNITGADTSLPAGSAGSAGSDSSHGVQGTGVSICSAAGTGLHSCRSRLRALQTPELGRGMDLLDSAATALPGGASSHLHAHSSGKYCNRRLIAAATPRMCALLVNSAALHIPSQRAACAERDSAGRWRRCLGWWRCRRVWFAPGKALWSTGALILLPKFWFSKGFREFTPSWKKRAGAVSAVGYTACLTKSQPI